MLSNIKRMVMGRPFPNSRAMHERVDKIRGLAVFASDPISSNAYATEAIMTTLVLISAAALQWTLPIALVIAALVTLVILSYNQTIQHYPMGGGAYKVAKNNLGVTPSLFAAAALLTDYVLTVSVSVAAGIKAIISAFPDVPVLHAHHIFLGIGVIAIITWLNLRGVRESSTVFAFPTYAFVAGVLLVLLIGLVRYFGLFGAPPLPPRPMEVIPTHDLSSFALIWLILRAFAAGCTALTGIEAISNGVQAFREPAPRNAVMTMRLMGVLAMTLFIGISFLSTHIHIIPSNTESVLSQMTRTVVGTGPIYFWVQAFTMLILVLAANTAYQDFPRLSAILAQDAFLPRWMSQVGARLVFSTGILVLAGLAGAIYMLFDGDEIRLLPLYAIGVFTSFTLSQFGMVRFWGLVARLKPGEEVDTGETNAHYERGWRWKRLPSLIGGTATGIVLAILVITKFLEGAWIIVVAVPLFVMLFRRIHEHYDDVARKLSLAGLRPEQLRYPANVAIVPVGDIHRGSLRAIKYALRLSQDVRVVHVVLNEQEEEKIRARWKNWTGVLRHARLVFLYTEFRDLMPPLVNYIRQVNHQEFPGELVTVVVPEFVPDSWFANLLHNQTATILRFLLRGEEDTVVIDVPYHLRKKPYLSAPRPRKEPELEKEHSAAFDA